MPRQRARAFLLSESDTSDNSGDENIQPTQATCGSQPTKRKVVVTQYATAWKFSSYAEFDVFWEDESTNWINRSSHTSKKTGAYIQYFDCKYRERLESNCSKKLKITKKDGLVTVDASTGEHQGHNENGDVLTAEVKQKITELMSDGRTPAQIRNKLQDLGLYVPMLGQVENFVAREKRKSGVHTPFTDLELHNYCAEFSPNNVEDPDDAHVLGYRYEKENNEQRFIVVWTTDNLWLKLQQSELLQIDSTYGMLWGAFPVQMVGFSDASHKFHPVAIAVASNENKWMYNALLTILRDNEYAPRVVLADGCASITDAVAAVYPGAIRTMCWAHAARAMDRKLTSVPLDHRRVLRDDINNLQLSVDAAQFERAAELMREKWRRDFGQIESAMVFEEYFYREWICGPLRFWYEGASTFVSQNNGLEALNKVTKELDMERKRVSFRGFVQAVEKVVQRWSTLPDYQDVKVRPKITPHTFFLAYQLKREIRVQIPNEDGTWAYVASTKNKAYTDEDIADKVESLERHEYDTWEAFKELRFGVHFIELKDHWYRCSCRIGVKKVLCKHAVRLMCTKKLLEYPPDAMAEPVEERRKPKRGRPSKMKKLQVLF